MAPDTAHAALVVPWGPATVSDASTGIEYLHRLRELGVHVAVAGQEPPDLAAPTDGGPGTGWYWACTRVAAGHAVTGHGPAGRRVRVTTEALPAWLLHQLWHLGVARELVAFADPERGGQPSWLDVADRLRVTDVVAFLDQQVRRQRHVPVVAEDPGWSVVLVGDEPRMRRVHETLLTLGDTQHGTRGTPVDPTLDHEPLVATAGVYTHPEGPGQRLLGAPDWTRLATPSDRPGDPGRRRVLDLRAGVLLDEVDGGLRSARFLSVARPGVACQRTEDPTHAVQPVPVPVAGDPAGRSTEGGEAPTSWARTVSGPSTVSVMARTRVEDLATHRVVDRLAVLRGAPRAPVEPHQLQEELDAVAPVGFGRLLSEHRAAWARRWADADVVIEGDEDAQRSVRFALFHLMASVPTTGEAAVGARGLSGHAYAGHVFWDADVYVLPFLAATFPAAARAMLEYRVRRVPEARARAARAGHAGARFPWESAASGADVTPHSTPTPDGSVIPVLTGTHEEHVSAAVAWAAHHYTAWTGDEAFLHGPGRPLVVETARFWDSRTRVDRDGRAHIDEVIGPDEYHGLVDDNAYTNVMARWNLRRGAELVRATMPETATRWEALADALVDGFDPTTRVHEQFAGFHQLEPLLVSQIAPPPVAADVLLGHARVQQSQVVKQPDVALLHHLVPEEVPTGSLAADLDHYLPRTAHGSSLSPAIFAALLARAGRPDDALPWFRLATCIDLDDLTGTTAGGLHVAAMGGAWQAVATGFLGLRPTRRGELAVDPHLPAAWDAVALRCRMHGRRVHVRADHDHVAVETDGPLTLRVNGRRITVRDRWTGPADGTRRTGQNLQSHLPQEAGA